jgi:hypothetical protein
VCIWQEKLFKCVGKFDQFVGNFEQCVGQPEQCVSKFGNVLANLAMSGPTLAVCWQTAGLHEQINRIFQILHVSFDSIQRHDFVVAKVSATACLTIIFLIVTQCGCRCVLFSFCNDEIAIVKLSTVC